MAIEVEAGFKVKEIKEEAEKILLDNGFVNTFKTAHTRDVYFGKDIEIEGKSEEEIKRSMVRLRGFETFDNGAVDGNRTRDPTFAKIINLFNKVLHPMLFIA